MEVGDGDHKDGVGGGEEKSRAHIDKDAGDDDGGGKQEQGVRHGVAPENN